MTKRIYESIEPINKTKAEESFNSGVSQRIIKGLLSSAFNIDDWQWVQDNCLRFLDHSDQDVREAAVVCLGHLARIHKTLDTERVLPVLTKLEDDPKIGGEVSYTLEEIEWYTRRENKK